MLYFPSSTYKCDWCGMPANATLYKEVNNITMLMNQHNICYRCAYWKNLADNTPENLIVIDGVCYLLNNKVNIYHAKVLNNDYSEKNVFIPSTGTLVRTNNLMLVGTPCEPLKNRFSNNAVLISSIIYNKLRSNDFMCYAKGCFDRYHCFRYAIEYEETPYNKIPEDYTIGEEDCPSFININEIPTL